MRFQRLGTGLVALAAALAAGSAAGVAASAAGASRDWYVAVGDSYSRGSQPGRATGDEGFAYQLPAMARARGYDLQVANFACGGATSASLLARVGCDGRKTRVQGDQPYPDETQVAAATRFIAGNRGRIGLVTVSVGLNDLRPCLKAPELLGCTGEAATAMRANVSEAARALREAAGPNVPIVGVGYPNVYLGSWLRPGGGRGHERAREMQAAFRSQVNPALRAAYRAGQGSFADATKASGGYGSLESRVPGPTGAVPAPVASICRLSWFCSEADIHLNRAGYRVVARTVVAQLPRRPATSTVAQAPHSR